ncbi:ThiF family adenylyltransferase [Lactococcus garvieae]|nr:ThiF family adenylyltransferase [Lactococcus garvieae]MCO7128698.1 ThiF family adenylyltransferase [Lactococcus garvieae]MDN5625141.1 ThiF family adenylyltransferase [Acinetobacter sp.]QSQ97502.1 ThiF family adenylyltransferase [Lactococcus garvieae]
MKFLVIGVGSLGSAITELMVRAGIIHMDVIDSDILTMGNLVRHKLVASDIGSLKAVKMEEPLTSSNIHYDGKSFSKTFEEFIQKEQDRLPNYDIVIETTGEDVVFLKFCH